MSQLIRLIGRGAFVALGLTAGFQANAASVTIDAGSACVGFTWNGSTLSCTVDTACVVSGPSTGTPGQDVVLTASCPTSTTITWSGTGTCSPGTGNTCTANEVSAVGNKTYIATGNQSAASPAKTVNWTSNVTQPGGCTLSASPSSGSAATNVTLTAACSTGTTPITLAWTGTGTGSCPTSMSGLSTTCTVNNVAATTTWSVNFSNSAGNNNKSATFTYNAGGGGSFANCPAGSETINHSWGGAFEDRVITQGFGDNIVSIKFTIPAGTTFTGPKQISVVEFIDPATLRDFAISTVACSFSFADALKTANGTYAAIQTANQSPGLNYGVENKNSFYVAPTGVPIYINLRNRNATGGVSCAVGNTCNAAVTIRD